MNNNSRYQPFIALAKCGEEKVPIVDDVTKSHDFKIYPITVADEGSVEFEFTTDRNVYTDLRQTFLSLHLKFVKGRGYDAFAEELKREYEENGTASIDFFNPRNTHVNNLLHSLFSNVEMYINNQQVYHSNSLYAHKSYISNNFKGAISEYMGVLHCEGYNYEMEPGFDIDGALQEPFSSRRSRMVNETDGFYLYGKLGIDFFTTATLLYPNTKVRIRLIKANPSFYMLSANPHVDLKIQQSVLHTKRIELKEEYHQKNMDMLAYSPVKYTFMETRAKTFIIPNGQNQFIQENIFNNEPIRRIAVAMNTNSAFTGSFEENPFWFRQFGLRNIRILRGGHAIVDFDTTDICRLYVTTMVAMSYQDDIPSVPFEDFRDHYVLVFDLTSMQDAAEHCHYPELIGEPLRLQLDFKEALSQVTEVLVLGERMSMVAVDKFGVVGKNT